MKIVTCIYTNLAGTPFGGSHKFRELFIFSLKSISKIKHDIICYTSKKEYDGLVKEFKSFDNVEIRVKELTECVFHSKIKEVKKTTKCTIELLRCYELVHLKTQLLNEVSYESDDSDFVFWIDAGLSYRGLFPHKTFVQPICTSDFVFENYNNTFFTPNLFPNIVKTLNNQLYFITQTRIPGHIIGGIFGGGVNKVKEFWKIYSNEVEKTLDNNLLFLEERIFSDLIRSNRIDSYVDEFADWYHEDSGELKNDNNKPFYTLIEKYK